DQLRRHGELADEPVSSLRPGEDRVDERRKRAPDRELVVDRLRELDRLGDLGGRPAPPPGRGPPPPPPAPRAPPPPPPPPRPRLPPRAPGGQRPLERLLEPPVEALDPSRLEVDAARLGRLDGEAGVLEPAQEPLPRLLGARRILLHEHERGAGRERLTEPHPRADARRCGDGGHRPEERLSSFDGRERRRPQHKARPSEERRSKLESRDE